MVLIKECILLSSILFFSIFFSFKVFAHSGGLNQQGCHNNKKTGGYHCHRSQNINPLPHNIECKLTIGDQYYIFNPKNTEAKIKFEENNGEVEINCYAK